MISNLFILAEGARDTTFSTVLLVVYAFFVVLIIIAVVFFLRFFGSGIKEMKLMRLEIGKLAEELRLLRQEAKKQKNPNA